MSLALAAAALESGCATDDWPSDGSCECLSVGCVDDDAGCACGVVPFGVPESAILGECTALAPGLCCLGDSPAAPYIDGACFCPDEWEGGYLEGYVEVASCSAATLVCASALKAVDVRL